MKWSKTDTNGIYWWRYDKDAKPEPVEVRDGMAYGIADADPTSTTVGEFLGPITPDQFTSGGRLREVAETSLVAFEQYRERHFVSAAFVNALANLRKVLKEVANAE